jgi:predicted amidohydrolase YtcJ
LPGIAYHWSAPTKLADLAVLSQDIFTVPVEALPRTTSVLTILGGKVVHEGK